MSDLTSDQKAAALALAEAILPAGRLLPAADGRTVAGAERFFAGTAPAARRAFGTLVATLDHAAVLSTGRRFRSLSPARREEVIARWERSRLLRWPLYLVSAAFEHAHFDNPRFYDAIGCEFHRGGRPESARWTRQVIPSRDTARDEEIECDAVVVGTGAGGAVVAKELASRGHAVVLIEEGELHRRDEFDGRTATALRRLYRDRGGLVSVGNTVMPIMMGRMVGGSTAINGGTCYRAPAWALARWCDRIGSDELSAERLAPHYERIESDLGVGPADARYLGGVARVVARGSAALGFSHGVIPRNAPDCDGQGLCTFGCPTDAKRSTNVSYVPWALSRGAVLYTGLRARRVLVERGRAVGVEARAVAGAGKLTVRASAVVLSGGAIPTPRLLLAQGICNSSGQVGRNLSVHPTTMVSALFDEPIAGYNAVPQGYACNELVERGVLLLAAGAPPSTGPLLFAFHGRRLVDVMDRYDRIATVTVIEIDDARGRVRPATGRLPSVVTYSLASSDVRRLHEGVVRTAQIFRAAGARAVYPLLPRLPVVGPDGLDALLRFEPRPSDFVLTSVHPLGTCRMGTDPRTSVVSPTHETHDLPRLFLVDGSSVPTTPRVNPQLTLMAMASRASRFVADRLD